MLRTVLVIASGFVLIGALAVGGELAAMRACPALFDPAGGTRDTRMLLFLMTWVFVAATFGCWLTARLAASRPMWHAMVLGVLGLAFNVAGTIAKWSTAPAWYHVLSLLLVLPAAWLGGFLASRPRRAPLAAA